MCGANVAKSAALTSAIVLRAGRRDEYLQVVVFGGIRAAPSIDLKKRPPRIRLHRSAVGHGLLRFALDPHKQPDRRHRRRLSSEDLEPINRWVAICLGREPGKISAFP
jgi:hypothetical protein